MKLLLTVLSLGVSVGAVALGARALLCGNCCPLSLCISERPSAAESSAAPSGEYIEARSVSVFAGACHYNGEYLSAGREALLAWRFESGGFELDGAQQSLAGVELVALVVGDDNLAEPGVHKRALVFVDDDASPAQRDAAVAWLRAEHGAALGEITAIESTPVAVRRAGESYTVSAGDSLALAGATLPDRACCAMPFNVWYEPFQALEGRVVGCSESFRVADKRLGAIFERRGQNDAFLGRFGPARETRVAAL